MSDGNYKLVCRVDPDLLQEVVAELNRRNLTTKNEIWTLSDWVRAALQDKLDHCRRSRKKKKPKPTLMESFEQALNDKGGSPIPSSFSDEK